MELQENTPARVEPVLKIIQISRDVCPQTTIVLKTQMYLIVNGQNLSPQQAMQEGMRIETRNHRNHQHPEEHNE
jgi:hypothetical protein